MSDTVVNDFVQSLVRRKFSSFQLFYQTLKEYMSKDSVTFVVGSSKKNQYEVLKYDQIQYRCIYHTSNHASVSSGVRRV